MIARLFDRENTTGKPVLSRDGTCLRRTALVCIPYFAAGRICLAAPFTRGNGSPVGPLDVLWVDRRLSAWCASAAAVRALAQSVFAEEVDGAPFFLGFFLISGQRSRFHCRILSSSLSRAGPTGR